MAPAESPASSRYKYHLERYSNGRFFEGRPYQQQAWLCVDVSGLDQQI